MERVSTIVDDIDTGRLLPRSHDVARRLAQHEKRSGALGAEILAAFDAGTATENQHLLEKLWARIESLPLAEQGSLRTLVSLLHPDEPVDGHYAEYLIGWAQDEGVPTDAIETAFRGN
jgi:hypothetical protein